MQLKIVLLSGGSGKRLFPMSNEVRSKQFLRLLTDEQGNRISMLQRVWKQLERSGLAQDAYICASPVHSDLIQNQVGTVPMIEEPSSKDTFPAIALATLYLQEVLHYKDESIIVMPIDPYVELSFFEAFHLLEKYTKEDGVDIALIGVHPTAPSSKFGYISVDRSATKPYLNVTSFVEKPKLDRAQQLIEEGALWNCGVFAYRSGFLLDWLSDHGYPSTYQEMRNHWTEMPKISFDYEVVEKVSSAVVLPYRGLWKDLGTWDVMTSELTQPLIGNGVMVDNVNTHVINELHTPVIVAGTHDLVVISTPDGILVADKQHSVGVKEYSQSLQLRPMYVERRWGDYRVIEYRHLPDGGEMQVRYIRMDAQKSISYHMHQNHEETWTVVRGRGIFAVDKELFEIAPGSVMKIGRGQWHAVKALEELEFVEVQRGVDLSEEDIARRFIAWEEIEQFLGTSLSRSKNSMILR